MNHVVMFSGGIGSWAAAKRVSIGLQLGSISGRLTLLFADTQVEDKDTYRFLKDAAENVDGELVCVADGRTPFEVFKDDRFLGNARLANCSKFLKQRPCREWVDENCDPETTTLHFGIDWTEIHRLPAIVGSWQPYEVWAPLTVQPLLSKEQLLAWAKLERLPPPNTYETGYPHANCLAQGCVRGGQAYWRLLLRDRPDVYALSEVQEERLRQHLGKDVAILRDRRGGQSKPMTLTQFRQRVECGDKVDTAEWGGCGCFTE